MQKMLVLFEMFSVSFSSEKFVLFFLQNNLLQRSNTECKIEVVAIF